MWIICTAGAGTWWASTSFGWYDCCYIIYGDGGYNATIHGPTYYLSKTDWANVAIQVLSWAAGCRSRCTTTDPPHHHRPLLHQHPLHLPPAILSPRGPLQTTPRFAPPTHRR